VHVCDLASAHLLALEALLAGAPSAIYNVGTGAGRSVLEVIESVRRITGLPVPFAAAARRPGDPAVLVADAGLIGRALGWRPELSDLDTIVETAWAWHRRG
jgi:UDP-glucose 4-epimerase